MDQPHSLEKISPIAVAPHRDEGPVDPYRKERLECAAKETASAYAEEHRKALDALQNYPPRPANENGKPGPWRALIARNLSASPATSYTATEAEMKDWAGALAAQLSLAHGPEAGPTEPPGRGRG